MKSFVLATLAGASFLVGAIAHAAGGSFEINQACVEIGCFPDDPPGFPVQLNKPGNYVLTSNLTVTTVGSTAIRITTNNVTLDLGGFHVKGPVHCSGSPLTCTPAENAGVGVDGTALTRGSVVRNGSVAGFHWGVATDLGWRVSNLVSEHNQNLGFFVRKGTIVRDSAARFNGNVGFQVGELGSLINSVASNNRNAGISTVDSDSGGGRGGATVESNTVYANGQGILDRGRSLISKNAIFANEGYGVQVEHGGSLLVENRVMDNAGIGLSLAAGTAFSPASLPVLLKANLLSNNNGSATGPQIGGAGTYVLIGESLCGDNTSCP